jgi:hypothetical protein
VRVHRTPLLRVIITALCTRFQVSAVAGLATVAAAVLSAGSGCSFTLALLLRLLLLLVRRLSKVGATLRSSSGSCRNFGMLTC